MKRATIAFGSLLLLAAFAWAPAQADLSPLEELGKFLFFDTNLSTPPGQACAACHAPETAFAGPVQEINEHGAVYEGAVHGRFGNRKPPTAAYTSFSPDFYWDEDEELYVGGMFWDGRAANIVEQAKGPFLNPMEQNNPNKKVVVDKVFRSDYAGLFLDVWGPDAFDDVEAAYDQIALSIAAYETSSEVNRFSSKFDAVLLGQATLTEEEAWGLELFNGKGQCAACHPSTSPEPGVPPLFTDYTYDNLGVPRNPENPWYEMPKGNRFNPEGGGWTDFGLGAVVGSPDEMGKVKVPTLRNVGMKPYPEFVQAYMHNGFFKDLRDVVMFYNTRDVAPWPPPEVPENVNTDELGDLGLTDDEIDAIVAFMLTLTDGYMDMMPREELAAQNAGVPALSPGATAPNPFRTNTTIHFALTQRVPVSLHVYNVAGRLVRELIPTQGLSGGEHRMIWNGRDDEGRKVPAGMYFYRLNSGTSGFTGRLVRLD
jgi:cytochrome c peroxidase